MRGLQTHELELVCGGATSRRSQYMWQEMGEPVTVFDAEGSLENIKEKTVDGFIIAGTTARGGVRARGTAAIAGAIVGSIDGITDVRQYMRRLRPKVTIYGP